MSRAGRQVSRWVAAVGIVGTVLLAVGAFSLSFTSLTHLAVRSGIDQSQAWEWPLIVDGVIVVATVSVVALGGRRGTGYAWALLGCAAMVSVLGNAAQAVRLPSEEPAWIAAAVATVPPIVLLAATHMTVILTRPDHAAENTAADAKPAVPPMGADAQTGLSPVLADSGLAVADARTGEASAAAAALDRMGRHAMPVCSPGAPLVPEPSVSKPVLDGDAGDWSRTLKAMKARSMREAGWTVSEIAHGLGVSAGSVRRYLKTPEPSTTTIDPNGDPQ